MFGRKILGRKILGRKILGRKILGRKILGRKIFRPYRTVLPGHREQSVPLSGVSRSVQPNGFVNWAQSMRSGNEITGSMSFATKRNEIDSANISGTIRPGGNRTN